MERLTEKVTTRFLINPIECVQLKKQGNSICMETCNNNSDCGSCPVSEAFDKLAKYEDLEEAGELIRKQDLVKCIKGRENLYNENRLVYLFDKAAKKFMLDGDK